MSEVEYLKCLTTQNSLILILRLIEYQLVGKPSAEFLAFWFPLKQWLARLHSSSSDSLTVLCKHSIGHGVFLIEDIELINIKSPYR